MSDILLFTASLALINILLFGLYLDSHTKHKYNWKIFTCFPLNYLPLLLTYFLIQKIIFLFRYHLSPNTHEIDDKSILALIFDENFIYTCCFLYASSILNQILFYALNIPWGYNISSFTVNLGAAVNLLIKVKFKSPCLWLLLLSISTFIGHYEDFDKEDINITLGASGFIVYNYLILSEILACSWYSMMGEGEYIIELTIWIFLIRVIIGMAWRSWKFFKSNFCRLSVCYDYAEIYKKRYYDIKDIAKNASEPFSFAVYFLFSLFLSYYVIDGILSDFWIFKELLYFAGWMYVGGLTSSMSWVSTKWAFILNASGAYAQFLAFRFVKSRIFM